MARKPRDIRPQKPHIDPPFSSLSPPSRLRIGLYARVSTLDQHPEAQSAELRAWAARQGGTVALDVAESGSGASNGRPGLQRLLTMAQRGQLDVVATWKLDRWARSALDALHNIRLLSAAGVRFTVISQGIDIRPGGDPMSNLLLTMLSAVSEFERSLIVERTRLGLARAKAKGKILGRPKQAHPTVQQVAALRAAGRSWAQIAAELKCTARVARLRHAEHLQHQAGR